MSRTTVEPRRCFDVCETDPARCAEVEPGFIAFFRDAELRQGVTLDDFKLLKQLRVNGNRSIPINCYREPECLWDQLHARTPAAPSPAPQIRAAERST